MIRSTQREVLNSGSSFTHGRDIIIAGSDQIWNKSIVTTDEALRFYYLMWAEKSKRACYAPSFGDSKINSREFPLHKKGLEGFRLLSCREKLGCELIRELTGREAKLVLDPTLLLTAEQWREISRKPDRNIPEHYVIRYCWNRDTWKDEHRLLADGREIIDIMNYSQGYYSSIGPREFIWLIPR